MTDYNTLTVAELRPIAKDLEIQGYSRFRKSDLIAAITKATAVEDHSTVDAIQRTLARWIPAAAQWSGASLRQAVDRLTVRQARRFRKRFPNWAAVI